MHCTHLGHHHAQFHMELAQRSECVEPDITLWYHYIQCHRREVFTRASVGSVISNNFHKL